jgi:hypothetical protein
MYYADSMRCAVVAVVAVAALACSSPSSNPQDRGGRATVRDERAEARPKIEPRELPPPPQPRDTRGPSLVDMSSFEVACASDADCTLVDRAPCNRCGCADTPIAKKHAAAFAEAAAGMRCIGVQIYPCGDCLLVEPHCADGVCTARSTEPAPPEGSECQHDRDCVVSCSTAGKCCPPAVCETTIARSKAEAIDAENRERCTAEALARCGPPDVPEYIVPRCRRGVCFGQFLKP